MDINYDNLDDKWINDFDKLEKVYKDFYKDDLYYINLKIIYVNRDNEIEKIKCETFFMKNMNTISREEIIKILTNNSYDNNKKYTLLSMLKYNLTLEPDEIKNYLKNELDHKCLTVINNIDTIKLEKSISMFQDLNDLILIFCEKKIERKKTGSIHSTKKKYFYSSNTKNI
jgi:hypothetical protein